MCKYLFYALALFSFSIGFSEEIGEKIFPDSSLASFSGLPSTVINNCVSVISGEYFDVETDVSLAGPEPLILRRIYSSSNLSEDSLLQNAWKFDHTHCAIIGKTRKWRERDHHKKDDPRPCRYWAYLSDASGAVLHYEDKRYDQKLFELEFQKPKGLTNCIGAEISGRTNLKNQAVGINEDRTLAIVTNPAGDKLQFDILGTYKETGRQPSPEIHTRDLYLRCDQKASGHHILYHYKDLKKRQKRLSRILAAHHSERLWYSWLEFDLEKEDESRTVTVTTSTRKKIEYKFHYHTFNDLTCFYLNSVIRSDRPI
jgi:hypothetical protein